MDLELSPPEQHLRTCLKRSCEYAPNSEISGLFEIHLTVDVEDRPPQLLESFFQNFAQACDQVKCKTESLLLDQGIYPNQIMTVSWQKGKTSEAVHQMQTIRSFLSAKGFKIIREKIEAESSNKGLPQTDEEAKGYPESNYFEFHLSVVPTKTTKAPLEDVCKLFNGYLASELFKDNKKDKTRYITMRYYGIGVNTAEANLNRALAILKENAFRIRGKVEMEYAILDTNLQIDNGWVN